MAVDTPIAAINPLIPQPTQKAFTTVVSEQGVQNKQTLAADTQTAQFEEAEANKVVAQVNIATNTLSQKRAELSTKKSERAGLEQQKSQLNTQVSSLQSQLGNLQTELGQANKMLADAQAKEQAAKTVTPAIAPSQQVVAPSQVISSGRGRTAIENEMNTLNAQLAPLDTWYKSEYQPLAARATSEAQTIVRNLGHEPTNEEVAAIYRDVKSRTGFDVSNSSVSDSRFQQWWDIQNRLRALQGEMQWATEN